jgi:hypothetical protein
MPKITLLRMFYDKSIMRHLEMHLFESSEDQRLGNEIGLETSDGETCENCFKQVGDSVFGKFTPFVLVLDDEAEWIICKECATPVL